LWRDLKIDGNRANLETSFRNRSIADLNVENRVIAMEVTVKNAYLTLLANIERLNVARLNFTTAEEALRAANARVQVGVSPQLDIITQEVNVQRNRAAVIDAEASIQAAEDALRTLVLDPARPDYWTIRLEPTGAVSAAERPDINLDQAIANALANRIDIRILKLQLENTDFALRVAKNATLPNLDLDLSYSASGTAGTLYDVDFVNGTRTIVGTRGWGGAIGDAFGAAYPAWTISTTFQYPLGRNSAIASYTSQQLARRQQELSLQQLELSVASAVRTAARQLQTAFQRVEVVQAQLRAATQQQEAEEKKFAVGLSSTLDLQNVQNQLTAARVAELDARIAYMRALIDFESVQRIN
jgi:outer membrane protein TolC